MKKPVLYFVFISAAIYSPILAADDIAQEISSGKAIFDRLCSSCHRAPTAIHAPAAEIETKLVPGAIRQHRFNLSDIEIKQVTKYIVSVRS